MNNIFFVSGIDTEIGKTVVSSILVRALEAHYWKPVQSGDLDHTDSMKVSEWAKHSNYVCHPEGYRLHTPASPHYSAALDGVQIELNQFSLPKTDKKLIVEGAGGLFVPLNEKDTILDLIAILKIPVILVSKNYLGSINHTLLSVNALKQRGIPIAGLVFNGEPTPSTEDIIESMTGLPILFRLEPLAEISRSSIEQVALRERTQLLEKLQIQAQ